MARVIKGVLQEELRNSRRMRRRYQQALRKLGKGSLSLRMIRGHRYYYRAVYEKGRMCFRYLGKLSPPAIAQWRERERQRKRYRRLLREVKRQIAFLERMLRGIG